MSSLPLALLDADVLDALAVCLRYPGPRTARVADAAGEAFAATDPTLAQRLVLLGQWLDSEPAATAEVWYTRLFDLDPRCTLDLGYHLFGESYRRGELLARLAPEHVTWGVELAGELADHQPALLQLVGRLTDREDQALLLRHVVLPGLSAVNRRLGGADGPSPWAGVLAALEIALARDADRLVPADPAAPAPIVEAPRA